MFDPSTSDLIRVAPRLEGLDRERLPERLTDAFSQVVAARIRMRTEPESAAQSVSEIITEMQKLALTYEAMVAAVPNREDRQAAAFVAASARLAVFNAQSLLEDQPPASFVGMAGVSADISAMILFLIAEAMPDAAELARRIRWETEDPIQRAVIGALRDLGQGRLSALLNRRSPSRKYLKELDPAEQADRALYYSILLGIRWLAEGIMEGPSLTAPSPDFKAIQEIAGPGETLPVEEKPKAVAQTYGAFAGPHHLAALLEALGGDIMDIGVANVTPPDHVDGGAWQESVRSFAETRPFLWPNHRDAIAQGYLRKGHSAVVGFPTGAGKSTLAELKINATLLAQRMVVFLAPTHALVDQTVQSLKRSFPKSTVQGERSDELGFSTGGAELPAIAVMTPEACLAQMSIDPHIFDDVGLMIFDECHLIHPKEDVADRRPIDAMLCIMSFIKRVPKADLLLLSAMMKNTEELAAWIQEQTERPCLALSLSWKPTRQLRGSIVYEQSELEALQLMLNEEKKRTTNKTVPASTKDKARAKPFGFFSLHQTWQTREARDYSLHPLIDEAVKLGVSGSNTKPYRLTPSSGEIASAIAAEAARDGMKVLVFFQTIKNANAARKRVQKRFAKTKIELRTDEQQWLSSSVKELGGREHLYFTVKDGEIEGSAGVHHGLLLPEERRLVESLFRRKSGVSVLTATSTLAQGMNLPSEFVIIAEDSRYDQNTSRREVLAAQELLNAAGRAGRAGENAAGVVLVVPGNVVGINMDEKKIGRHWTTLQNIFGQSDQCLAIDDPITQLMDRIHVASDISKARQTYLTAKLASLEVDDLPEVRFRKAASRTFGAFRARRDGKTDWYKERVETAAKILKKSTDEAHEESIESSIAATIGFPVDVVERLSAALKKSPPKDHSKVPDWRRWFFRWLKSHPDVLDQVFRKRNLDEIFGTHFAQIEDPQKRCEVALPALKTMSWLWMRGAPLRSLERVLGAEEGKEGMCVGARRFALRIVPDLAYLFGLPAMLEEARVKSLLEAEKLEDHEQAPLAVMRFGRCARIGVNSLDKLAYAEINRSARFSRREIHERFERIRPYLLGQIPESWDMVVGRVEDAIHREIAQTDWSLINFEGD